MATRRGSAVSRVRTRPPAGRRHRTTFGACRSAAPPAVVGEHLETSRRIPPDLEQIRLHGFDTFRLQFIDTPGALGLVTDEPGIFEQAEMARDGGTADG